MIAATPPPPSARGVARAVASCECSTPHPGVLVLTLSGHLDAEALARLWTPLLARYEGEHPRTLVIDGAALTGCDGAGVALLVELRRRQRLRGMAWRYERMPVVVRQLLELFPPQELRPERVRRDPLPLLENVGRWTVAIRDDAVQLLSYLGEVCAGFAAVLRRPSRMRWRDFFLMVELAGVNALPILTLLAFLLGVILAFNATIPLSRFPGAQVYIADLVSISLVRELGPLLTAIVLAGRSGSSFAAELGTMRVREEIDALNTMGLSPVRFLVLPRVLAAVCVMPLLTLFANLIGIGGGAVVMGGMGIPLVLYVQHVKSAVTLAALLAGLFKAAVFGALIAGISCLRGLSAERGPSAVGDAATRAVVSSLVLIIQFDGLFAVIFYILRI